MNNLRITGRIVDSPDSRVTPKGRSVTSFILASKPPPPGRMLYLKCVAWAGLATEVAALLPGTRVVVLGFLSSTKWQDRAGNTHNRVELVVEDIGVCPPRKREASHSTR